jgi:hypothetical protein
MSELRKAAIRARLLAVRDQYGKVGLLIDDAAAAGSRVARELYGAERLPAWWLQARSIECGAHALEAFADAFASPHEHHGARGLVLIDRFLPETDDKTRPAAWDLPQSGDGAVFEAMKQAVRRLQQVAESQGVRYFDYDLITSYPHVPLAAERFVGDGLPFPWKTRNSEVLYQRRRNLPSQLRAYGPENSARASADEARWKALSWSASIQALADVLANPSESRPVVLFTGAGASLAEGVYGAGMPPTWWLLEETCRRYVHDVERRGTGRLKDPEGKAPPRMLEACCHTEPVPSASEPKPLSKGEAPILQLINYLLANNDHSAKDLELRLEDIFSRDLNSDKGLNVGKFHEHFRSQLERFDHGFAYHHWLLAQMPWTRIITTNFDGCHERAAFAAASDFQRSAEIRRQRLSLGSVFPEIALDKSFADVFPRLAESSRLFKPYGNLLSPGEIGLSDHKLRDLRVRLRPSFHGLGSAERGWLVVVGNAMKDNQIEYALKSMGGTTSFLNCFELLWVVPDAFRRCTSPDKRGAHSTWEKSIAARMRRYQRGGPDDSGGHPSGPLPGTALEFAYDLFTAFQEAKQRQAP